MTSANRLTALISRSKTLPSQNVCNEIYEVLQEEDISDDLRFMGFKHLVYDCNILEDKHKYVVACEKFLWDTKNVLYANNILQVLISYGNPISFYSEYILSAIHGFSWDIDGLVQAETCYQAAILYEATHDSRIICSLLSIVEGKNEEAIYNAYNALLECINHEDKPDFSNWLEKSYSEILDYHLLSKIKDDFGCAPGMAQFCGRS